MAAPLDRASDRTRQRHKIRAELMALRDIVNAEYEGHRIDTAVFDAAELFVTCEHCGETVDRRRLGDVLWHDSTLCAPD